MTLLQNGFYKTRCLRKMSKVPREPLIRETSLDAALRRQYDGRALKTMERLSGKIEMQTHGRLAVDE